LGAGPTIRSQSAIHTTAAQLRTINEIPYPYRRYENLLMNYDLDPYEHSDDELCNMIVAIFYIYGISQQFRIPDDRLRSFVQAVRKSYQPQDVVVFHNFKHVFNVTHLCFHMLMCKVDEKLTPFDVFALLVAALCHDMDHPGVNNSFMIASLSDLAKLYANDSVLERHHAHMMQRLLSNIGTECDILCDLSMDDRTIFISLVSHAILATDMTRHMLKVNYFTEKSKLVVCFPRASESDSGQRRELLRSILHTVDIGSQSHCTTLAARWCKIVAKEFSAQYQKEIQLGLPPSLVMADLDDDRKLAVLQSEFIEAIVLPLWSAVADCFPLVQPRVDQLNRNLEFYLRSLNL